MEKIWDCFCLASLPFDFFVFFEGGDLEEEEEEEEEAKEEGEE